MDATEIRATKLKQKNMEDGVNTLWSYCESTMDGELVEREAGVMKGYAEERVRDMRRGEGRRGKKKGDGREGGRTTMVWDVAEEGICDGVV